MTEDTLNMKLLFELFNSKKEAKAVIDHSDRLYNEGIVYPSFSVFSPKLNFGLFAMKDLKNTIFMEYYYTKMEKIFTLV